MDSQQVRIDKDTYIQAKIEAAIDGITLQEWLSRLIRREVKNRAGLRTKPSK